MKQAVIFALVFASAAAPANGATGPLPRKAMLGVQLQPSQQPPGAAVGNVIPGSTGAAMGIRSGDVITAINGKAMASPADVVAAAQAMREGIPVSVELSRAGKRIALRGNAVPKPLETYKDATVDYGEVPFRDGRLRDILVMPAGKPDAPIVFYLQGYTCASMEASAADPFGKQFGDAALAHGLGYYRVEKIGVGDSDGSLKCVDVDYATELDGFRAAYRHLVDARKIAPDRIFMLGHSMGGLQAPMLAAETAPRGIAVYGTVVRNWADYHRELSATQGFLITARDPADEARAAEAYRDVFRHFYFDRMAPKAIAAGGPAAAAALRDNFAWDDNELMFGRNWKFAQDLASINLLDAWKKSRTNVLAIYGESDMVALTDVDHRYLADIANYWRPGSGTYVVTPKTDHGMNLIGTRAEIREASRAGKELPGTFNPMVVDELAAWIERSMAKPPLASV